LEKNKLTFILILLFLLMIFNSLQTGAYSNKLEDFILDGKNVQLKLYENLDKLKIIPGTNVVIKSIDGSQKAYLVNDKEYTVRPYQQEEARWFIQIFASKAEDKANNLKKDFLAEFDEQDVQIIREEGLYKVIVGNFSKKNEAESFAANIKEAGWQTWIIEDKVQSSNDMWLVIENEVGNIVFEDYMLHCEGVIRFKNHLYNGNFHFLLKDNKIDVYNKINFLTLEYGLLLEAFEDVSNMTDLKVGAILNRSRALNIILKKESPYVIDEYRGISKLNDNIKSAVDQTQAKVIYKNGAPYYQYMDIKNTDQMYSSAEALIYDNLSDIEIKDLNTTLIENQLIDAKIDIGLKYKEIRQLTWSGPRILNIVDLDITMDRYQILPFISNDKIEGLAPLCEVVRAKDALVGVNGGFFNYQGKPLGVVMIDGTMVTEPLYKRAAFGITKTGECLIDNIEWRGVLKTKDNSMIIIDALNRKPNDKSEIILYNQYYGTKTPVFNQYSKEIVVETGKIKTVEEGGLIQNIIPKEGFIIKIFNESYSYEAFQKDRHVEYTDVFSQVWYQKEITNIMGGGPKLISDGEISITSVEEEFKKDITEGMAPRTAVALTVDQHLLFINVDGRQPETSIGMKLKELAQYLKDLGVKEAMNLDGGNSSQLVIRGHVFNNPSGYRDIGTGILIKKK